MPTCRGKSQDDPRQLRVRQCGTDTNRGHSGYRGGKTHFGTIGQGRGHKPNVANAHEPKGNREQAPPSPVRREAPADQRHQQHRQRRGKQGSAGHLHADVERRPQEKREIDQHGPVAELDGGQQRGDPGYGRRREHTGIEHGVRTAPLLPKEHGRRRCAANEASGSQGKGTVAPQQCIDHQAQRNRQQRDANGIQLSPFLIAPFPIIPLGDQLRHGQGQRQAKGHVCEEYPAPTEPRRQEAPERRPQCHGDARDHPHDTERTGSLSDVRKGDCDECSSACGHEGRADTLCGARGQEHRFAQGQPARD
jgi:hypothetical protein